MELVAVLLATALAGPPVEVSTLDGKQHTGQLVSLTAKAATMTGDAAELAIPVPDVLEIRFPASKRDEPGAAKAMTVRLTDGSCVSCTEISATARQVACAGLYAGRFEAPPSTVASLQFAPTDDRVKAAWQDLLKLSLKRDLLVIRKGDVLDYQDGIVGDIDDKLVKFSLEGEEIPIKREKVFGVIYARRPASDAKPLCRIDLGKSDELYVDAIAWEPEKGTATLSAGARVEFKPDAWNRLDFSLGKLRYLSQMEPRVKYTPYLVSGDERVDVPPFLCKKGEEYRRDRNLDGGPLRIGKQEFARGLAIHSRTVLNYRLAGEYRRLQAVMGIDASVAGNGWADVTVVISGDGKTLLKADVRGRDPARPIDLDVSGVRDLEILVDFGSDAALMDVSDHLDLADAKVTK